MNLKCPFSAPLTKGDFGCRHGEEVVRRGGSEFDCRSPASHDLCCRLFEELKRAALPAFEVEDDPTSMPHSVLVKIQYGGLRGVKRLAEGEAATRIPDISATVAGAQAHYGSLAEIPYADLVGDITGYKLQRRTRRR